jgi:hypothetical protein
MAGKILNRRQLREPLPQAQVAGVVNGDADVPEDAGSKKKAKKAPVKRKPRAKKVSPRMCARWGVFDGTLKQLAIFDFNCRAAADEKLADLVANKKGSFFVQIVKEPMPAPLLVEAALGM